jgi:hypothetical protein
MHTGRDDTVSSRAISTCSLRRRTNAVRALWFPTGAVLPQTTRGSACFGRNDAGLFARTATRQFSDVIEKPLPQPFSCPFACYVGTSIGAGGLAAFSAGDARESGKGIMKRLLVSLFASLLAVGLASRPAARIHIRPVDNHAGRRHQRHRREFRHQDRQFRGHDLAELHQHVAGRRDRVGSTA